MGQTNRGEDLTGRASEDARVTREEVLEAVRTAIADIEYGSVLIKIHQGEVVGIETSTKLRLRGGPSSS